MSYDVTTDIGKVRFQIQDTVEPFTVSDAEISAMFEVSATVLIVGGKRTTVNASTRRVAATCLDAIANNPARLAQHLKVLDIDVDLSAGAKEMRAAAMGLRAADDENAGFAISEVVSNHFAAIQRIENQVSRGAI
jgi:hypothetical protein